jgi:hypothetical protein
LNAAILWRGAQEDAASFLASEWLWQSKRGKDGNHLHLLSCCVAYDAQRNKLTGATKDGPQAS